MARLRRIRQAELGRFQYQGIGAHPYVVHEVETEMKRLGYNAVRVIRGQENMICKVKEALDVVGLKVIPEGSAVQRHEGVADGGVKRAKEMIRTVRSCLRGRYKR